MICSDAIDLDEESILHSRSLSNFKYSSTVFQKQKRKGEQEQIGRGHFMLSYQEKSAVYASRAVIKSHLSVIVFSCYINR